LARARRRRNVFDPRVVLTGRGHGQVRKRFQAGQVIYSQGDPPEAAFFLESGSIKVSTVVRNGREAVLALPGPGDFFGVRCLLGTPHTATATALTDSSVVTTAALCRMVREVPDFAEMFATFLVQRCADDQERLISHLTHSAEQRLAYTLLRLASSNREDHALPIPISQSLFAKMIGTTRSRVSFFMNRFKRKGFIEYGHDGRIRVHQSLRSAVVEDWF
jgi:CRP/FNR family transcriptional regulator, cyclic AMP receptor protein